MGEETVCHLFYPQNVDEMKFSNSGLSSIGCPSFILTAIVSATFLAALFSPTF
jgi:hypothetical protein